MFNGRSAIVLFDPVDLHRIASVLDLDFDNGGAGFPCTGKSENLILVERKMAVTSTNNTSCLMGFSYSAVFRSDCVFKGITSMDDFTVGTDSSTSCMKIKSNYR